MDQPVPQAVHDGKASRDEPSGLAERAPGSADAAECSRAAAAATAAGAPPAAAPPAPRAAAAAAAPAPSQSVLRFSEELMEQKEREVQQ